MISPHQITFATIAGGPAIALVFWIWFRVMCKCWTMPISTSFGILGNAMAIVPLACVLVNIFALSYVRSFPTPGASADPSIVATTINGSEATVFLALIYALIMMLYAVHRAIAEAPKALKASKS